MFPSHDPGRRTKYYKKDDPLHRTEYQYCGEMFDYMNIKEGKHWEDRSKGGLNGAYKRIAKKGYNATIEPHLNAFNGKAKGIETLYPKGCAKSQMLAIRVNTLLKASFPDRVNRHTKALSPGDDGWANFEAAKKNGIKACVITEAFFIDNPYEWIDPAVMAEVFKEAMEIK